MQKLKIKIKEAIVLLITLLLPFSVSAAELKDVVDNLQMRYDKIKEFQADFSQEAVFKISQMAEKGTGKVYIKKPDMMRWDYIKPRRQTIIINKRDILIYLPDEKQVMKDKLPAGGVTPTTFISDVTRMRDDFNILLHKRNAGSGMHNLSLTPKKEGMNIKKVMLDVSENDYLILKLTITDLQDNVTTISFSNMKANAGVEDGLFAFKIPKGVEVIERQKAK
ncbi:MAG: outer membrane lipoprotein chaperone LolA [Nitrospirae bacterium]|nr:outer membrane lipoprotein chaperone LolA [Nitrospirota bacterium]